MTWLAFLIIGVVLLLIAAIALHPPWKEICLVVGAALVVVAAILALTGGFVLGGVDNDVDDEVGMSQYAIS